MKRFDRRLCVILRLALQTLWTGHANAVGALAVGVAPGGVEHGFASGVSWGYPTEADAQREALQRCRTDKASPPSAHSRCILIGTFKNQCASTAMDPKNGTPGAGWFIAADVATASRLALASCEATAGADRAGNCTVSLAKCDGAAQNGAAANPPTQPLTPLPSPRPPTNNK
jgi:hypothetical protein